ncbi:hypothetical protein HY469_05105 [Candidatus Roizmanbacteria bacterium]|nr:hypothetical protein [Candidatus Roizmanbacteria bacterium]
MRSTSVSSTADMLRFIILSFLVWRIAIELISRYSVPFLPIQETFLGPIPWANFDGLHYLGIAQRGYVQYEQAFFPLYSVFIRFIARLFHHDFVLAGMLISHVAFIASLILLWRMIPFISGIAKDKIQSVQKWTILFILAFPTSYYFASVYTESLFLFLIVFSFYFLHGKQYGMYALGAALASGVRIVGAFLLVPIGLISYMTYLWKQYGDPLLFLHVQPAFGANRSGDELIILPEVYYRYGSIFFRALMGWDPVSYAHGIALLEFITFNGALFLLWVAWRKGYPKMWIYFSVASIILPTLTGTLSSMPRYVLVAFPLFIILAQMPKTIKITLFIVFLVLLGICTLLFTHGYWIA